MKKGMHLLYTIGHELEMNCPCGTISQPNDMNPGYFPLEATASKMQQIPMFLHSSAGVWGQSVISTNIRTIGFCIKIAIIL